MARIPTYPGVRINAPQYSGPSGNEGMVDLGRGITDLGNAINRRDARISAEKNAAEDKRQVDEARVYAAKSLASLRSRMTVEETDLQNTIGPGAEGYTPEYLKRYDGFVEEILQGAPNEYAKQALTERAAELRGGFASGALTFEASAAQMQREKDMKDASRLSANHLLTKPSDFEAILQELDAGFAAIADKLPQAAQDKQSWDMHNELAVAAVEGELRVSPNVANKKLKSGYWDKFLTPDQKNGFLKAAESKLKTDNAVQRYNLEKAVDNHLAAIEETGVGIGVTQAQVAAVYGSEVPGLKFRDAERVSHKVHAATIEIGARQSPEERAQMLQTFRPDRVNKPNTFAEDREVYQRLTNALEQDVKLLQTDGAAWADRSGEISSIARASGTDAAVTASLAMQERGGVPAHEARVVPVAAAKDAVAAINAQSPKEKQQSLAALEADYGQYFPKVMTELISAGLSPEYMVIYNVNKVSPEVAGLLSESTGLKQEEIQSRFTASGRGAWSTVTAAVQGRFNQLDQASTYAYPGRRGQFNSITDLYAKTAGNLVLSNRFNSPQEASKYLYENSFGGMHVDRTFYLPQTTDKGTPINTDKAASELNSLLTNPYWVASRNLNLSITDQAGNVGNTRQKIDTEVIRSRGIWVNSADGKSLELFVDRIGGPARVYETLPTPKGKLRIQNPDGSYSSEESITVIFNNDGVGKHYNIPTIWDGKRHSQEEAIARARPNIVKGAYTSFDTQAEAVAAAKARSGAGGAAPIRRRPVTISLEDVANGKVRGNFTQPGDSWKAPGFFEILGTPGMN